MLSILAAKRRVTQHVSALYILFPWPSAIQTQSFAPYLFLGGIFFQLVPFYFTLPPSRGPPQQRRKAKTGTGPSEKQHGLSAGKECRVSVCTSEAVPQVFFLFPSNYSKYLVNQNNILPVFSNGKTYLLLAALFRKCMQKHWWTALCDVTKGTENSRLRLLCRWQHGQPGLSKLDF